MADAIVSIALQRMAAIIEKQIRDEINLVRGVKKEVSYLTSELKAIRNVLDDAERRGYKEKSIQHWLKKLEHTSHDIDDVLDEWNFAILKLQIEGPNNSVVPRQKVCSFIQFSCLSFREVATRHDIAKKIKGLKERLDRIVTEKDRYDFIVGQPVRESDRVRSTSSLDVSEIHGREADKQSLVRKLVIEDVGQEELNPRVISIVGTGGIGKTTLAQLVYNDDTVIDNFKLRIWICVSDIFDEVRIAKGIVEIVKGSSPNLNELEPLLKCVTDLISGKKILLVMDDVWTEDYKKWEALKNCLKFGAQGSKILVTARSERVARMMGSSEIYHLGQLSDTDCWLLMRLVAFFGRSGEDCEELQDICKNIANKCKGLPLAAKVLGSLLRFKDTVEEWRNVLDSETWELEEAEVELFPHLLLSYNELSPTMKRCFSYCAVFPKDTKIDIEKLIRMWMAQGYLSSIGREGDLELRGKKYFDNLRMRSFFVEYNGKTCKMHDIVHDFDIFDSTKWFRVLSLCECGFEEIPTYIENLIHLRYLDLTGNSLMTQVPQTICKLYNLETLYLRRCELKEIPAEIGNLIHLRHLDLYSNNQLKELPETICDLHDLRTLNLAYCANLCRLPEGIHRLINLRHLPNHYTESLHYIPQGLEQLTRLRTLRLFLAGKDRSKLGYLKKLNQLSGSLELQIRLHDEEDVVQAQNAELRNKIFIQCLKIWFFNNAMWGRSDEENSVRTEVMESLQPPPNLRRLTILDYQGSKFPGWITSPLNNLKVLEIQECNYCSTLPPLGKLPGLEELSVWTMSRFTFLDREFLGIAGDNNASLPSSEVIISFPKLKRLSFWNCPNWKDWEDITAEEADNANLSIFPCLKELEIECCRLTKLPHHLLRKAPSLERLEILDCNVAMEALQPPPNLRLLTILDFQGTKFPGWITSPLNNLKVLQIQECNYCSTLPPLGKLPGLEELSVWIMSKFKFLDREFLGIEGDNDVGVIIRFPKLKKLSFWNCPSWEDWEDITAEEADNDNLSIFSSLKELKIDYCGLTELPHRLLRKAISLERLIIQDCNHLSERYEDKKGSGWKLLSHIPR
ncbi:hypothetical protein DH2020_041299 [Rehmannia glutinosa]|uniref:Uncharacterized protein n=1 Tax=Rehmannia glutinosa TaxID=99300 RepID=A0ABR0UQK7_REHGL